MPKKTIKVTKDGIHEFKHVSYIDADGNETTSKKKAAYENVKCACGLEGTHTSGDSYVEVKNTAANKKLTDDGCKEKNLEKALEVPGDGPGQEEKKESSTQVGSQVMDLRLEYKFTEEEMLSFGRRMSESFIEIHKLEDELKSIKADYKAKITAHEQAISEYTEKIRNGSEEREVECTVLFHTPRMHEKTITRNDTGVEVAVIPMEDDDYTLFNQDAPDNPESQMEIVKPDENVSEG